MYAIIRVRMYAVTIAQPFGVGKVEGKFGNRLWVMLPNQTPNPQGGGMSQVQAENLAAAAARAATPLQPPHVPRPECNRACLGRHDIVPSVSNFIDPSRARPNPCHPWRSPEAGRGRKTPEGPPVPTLSSSEPSRSGRSHTHFRSA